MGTSILGILKAIFSKAQVSTDGKAALTSMVTLWTEQGKVMEFGYPT